MARTDTNVLASPSEHKIARGGVLPISVSHDMGCSSDSFPAQSAMCSYSVLRTLAPQSSDTRTLYLLVLNVPSSCTFTNFKRTPLSKKASRYLKP